MNDALHHMAYPAPKPLTDDFPPFLVSKLIEKDIDNKWLTVNNAYVSVLKMMPRPAKVIFNRNSYLRGSSRGRGQSRGVSRGASRGSTRGHSRGSSRGRGQSRGHSRGASRGSRGSSRGHSRGSSRGQSRGHSRGGGSSTRGRE